MPTLIRRIAVSFGTLFLATGKGNYERLVDEARRKLRAWERSNPK